jgi:hypothetical protein
MDEAVVVALRLAKEGFGDLEAILAMPADLVLDALEYSTFLATYQETHMELNRPQK